jgi:dTMP kinase
VLCDRYTLSSLVYQGALMPREFVVAANSRARKPDLTLFVDVAPEVAAARRSARGGPEELFEGAEIQRRVIAGYRREAELAQQAGEPLVQVDGSASPEQVCAELKRALSAFL